MNRRVAMEFLEHIGQVAGILIRHALAPTFIGLVGAVLLSRFSEVSERCRCRVAPWLAFLALVAGAGVSATTEGIFIGGALAAFGTGYALAGLRMAHAEQSLLLLVIGWVLLFFNSGAVFSVLDYFCKGLPAQVWSLSMFAFVLPFAWCWFCCLRRSARYLLQVRRPLWALSAIPQPVPLLGTMMGFTCLALQPFRVERHALPVVLACLPDILWLLGLGLAATGWLDGRVGRPRDSDDRGPPPLAGGRKAGPDPKAGI